MDKKNYNVYGIVFGTACEMPTEQRNNPWLLCHAIADAVVAYIENMPSVPHAPVQPRDIFDTEHTDDLPAEIKPKKLTPKPVPEPDPVEPEPELPLIDAIWVERTIDLVNNYIGSYSNPCSTSVGQCRRPCVQTELWLYDKNTDTLSVVDAEFDTLEKLHACLDPHVEYAKKHRTPPTWIDPEIERQSEKLVVECRAHRAARANTDANLADGKPVDTIGKSRLEQYVELYNMGFKPSRIATEMGISQQGAYSYKNLARKKGLIK
ncbi:MAG: hypothetical protein J6R99_02825 [Alphaproteobacteria bacterium]|nr:hypothetical protein [Alphaproteobacteria bacterium]MBO7066620.1 hypothetical protein [Alphaproteobacteria bacterium]